MLKAGLEVWITVVKLVGCPGFHSGRFKIPASRFFLVDKGPWYKSAFKSLGLNFVHVIKLENCVERWFRTVKEHVSGIISGVRIGGLFFPLPSGIILLGFIPGLVVRLVM